MLWVDAFFRFSGIGLIMLSIPMLIFQICCIQSRNKSLLFLVFSQFFLLVHLLGFTPEVFELPRSIRRILRMLDVGLLVAIWLFVLSLFKKNFKLNAFHIGAGLFVVTIMLAERMVNYHYLAPLPTWWAHLVNVSAFLIVIHMVYVSLTGHSDDLLEARRRTRIKMMVMVAVSVTIMIVLGSVLLPKFQPTINAMSLWPVLITMSFWILRVDGSVFIFDAVVPNVIETLATKDQKLHDDLKQLMVIDKVYLNHNITINSLAQSLGVGASRLRQHISQHLGFENFSTFINEYRINDIKQALSNRENNHLPILTLALNHGFNSLPPFNRAFKRMVGQTPSEYRNNKTK